MTNAMRRAGLRSLWIALMAAVLVALPNPARACVSSGFATICVDKPTVSGSGGGGGGGGGGSSSGGGGGGYQGPSRAERYAAARSEARQTADAWEATATNYLASHDYARAIEIYDKALKAYYTKANERYYENKKAAARQAWLDSQWSLVEAASRAERYDELPDLLKAAQRVWYSKDLQRQIDQIQKAMADRRDADKRAQKAAAEAAKNATKPDLTPARVATSGSDTKAGDQLLSAAAVAKVGDDLTINFDVGGGPKAGSLGVPTSAGSTAPTAATVEFSTHIPEAAKNDPVVQQSMAFFAKLDGQKADTQAKIAVVQQQIKSGAGDAAVLKAQETTLNNDLKRVEADQAKTKDQVKERLTSIHLDWNEQAPDKDDKKDDKKENPPGASHAH